MRFPVRIGPQFRIFYPTGFSMIIIKKLHKASFTFLTFITSSLINLFPKLQQACFSGSPGAHTVIKERRNLL